jgi:hypothetical protein
MLAGDAGAALQYARRDPLSHFVREIGGVPQ